MRFVVFALTFTIAAVAQESPAPQPAYMPAPPSIEYLKEAPDNNAKERGKGAMLITVGSIMLPLGIGMLGGSAAIWDGYSSSCSYSCDKYVPYLAGGLTLDILGTLVFASGATLLAVGAQKYVEHKKPLARFALTTRGFTF
jgi:hypothetical protein